MAKLSLKAGTTSKMLNVFFQDSSKTTGAGLAGISNNSAGLLGHFIREGESASNPIVIVSAAIGTYTTGGLVEIESSAMPGLYQIGLPNAICSANAKSATVYYFGATNLAPCVLEIELTGWDNQDAVHGGMSCLPNTAVTTNGSLVTVGTGTAQISVSAGMTLVQQGAAAGQLSTTNGIINATVVSVSSGILPPNFVALSIDAGGNVKTQTPIKKNVIVSGFSFVMTDNTTHVPRASLTVSANRSIDGGAFAACTNNVTEVSNGIYQTNLAAADVNGNNILLRFVAVSADDQNILVITNP